MIKIGLILLIIIMSSLLYSAPNQSILLNDLLNETKTFNHQKRIQHILTVADSVINKNKKTADPLVNYAINQSKKSHYVVEVVKGYNLKGDTEYVLGNYPAAVKWYKLALNHSSKINDFSLIAKVKANLGAIEYQQGNYQASLEIFNQALKIGQKGNDVSLLADIYSKKCISLMGLGEFDQAIASGKQSLDLRRKLPDKKKIIQALTTIGNVYFKKGGYQMALDHHFEAVKIAENINDTLGISNCYNNIGTVYNALGENEKALEFFLKSINLKKEKDINTASAYNNIAIIYKKIKNYPKAIEYLTQSLELKEKNRDLQGVGSAHTNFCTLYNEMKDFKKSKYHLDKAFEIFTKTRNNLGIISCYGNYGVLAFHNKDYDKALEYFYKGNSLAKDIKSQSLVMTTYNMIVKAYEAKGDYKEALKNYRMFFAYKDSLFNENSSSQIAEMQTKYDTEKKIRENELLKKDKEIQNIELEKSEKIRKLQYSLSVFLGIIVILTFSMFRYQKKANKIINIEKEKSDQLLLNILPMEIARELKEKGRTIPQSFNNVTVMFSDLVNFSQISNQLTPDQVINELNELFTEFDNIITRNNGERIKTVGDAYLAVCGMPEANEQHAYNIVKSALEFIQFIQQRNVSNSIPWSVRIGIHTGTVVGGVVGIKKYIYDVFGDAINTTSRIESVSQPMQINISEVTYELVKNDFIFEEDQSVHLKGIGNIKLYTVLKEI